MLLSELRCPGTSALRGKTANVWNLSREECEFSMAVLQESYHCKYSNHGFHRKLLSRSFLWLSFSLMLSFSRFEFSLSSKNLIVCGIHSAVWWMWHNLTHSFSDLLSLSLFVALLLSLPPVVSGHLFSLSLGFSCILLLYLCFTPTLCWYPSSGKKHSESRDERWRK